MMYEDSEIEDFAPWLVIIITVMGGFMRVLLLSTKGMWLDETLSVWVANYNVVELLQWVARIDQHPPLYYLLLHYWIAFDGDTAYAVRMLSAIIGAATIPMIYLIGKRLSGVMVGLAAAVLLALSPFNIRYAQETRMYTLLMFNAAVAIYALVILLTDSRASKPIGSQFREYVHAWRTSDQVEPDTERDFSYKNEARNQTGWKAWIFHHHWLPIRTIATDLAWVAFIVFSAATMLSHNTAVLFPLATNIFVLGLMLYQRLKKSESPLALQAPSFSNWVKAQLGIFLLWSPWVVAFINQVKSAFQEFWIAKPGWETVIQAIRDFLNESTLIQPSQLMVFWILYALLLCLGLVHFRKNISRFLFLAALFAIPFLGELLVSIRRPVFLDRTLIWTSLPLILVLAAGIVQLRFRLLMVLVLGILVTNNLFSAGDYYRFTQKEDWSTPAGFVANFAQKDDLILFNATKVQIPFDYYFTYYEDLYSLQVEKHGVPVDMFDSGVLEPKMTESDIPRLISLLSGHKTVWLVYGQDANTDPQGLIPQTLASVMKLVYTRDFNGGQVQIYAAP
jgi:mannosyltransferase